MSFTQWLKRGMLGPAPETLLESKTENETDYVLSQCLLLSKTALACATTQCPFVEIVQYSCS